LVAIVTFVHAGLNLRIAAEGCDTTVQAGIGLHLVAIVTRFHAGLDVLIATGRRGAVVKAGIIRGLVSIIAFFKTYLAARQITAQQSVTAASRHTGVGAGIVIQAVTVVTQFLVPPNKAITAARHAASGAFVTLIFIAVVTSLNSHQKDSITAAVGFAAVDTGI
jgi:hypothetical protein